MKSVDYIIVGQGLAGSALAVQLLWRGKQLLVIDAGSKDTASQIAAGLFNPITGKVMGLTWMADELFPYLNEFYKRVEQDTKSTFFYDLPIYRPFLSVTEQNEWVAACSEPFYRPFVREVHTLPKYPTILKDNFGGILLNQCGFLDTGTYLDVVKKWLISLGFYSHQEFDTEKLRVEENEVSYGNVTSKGIIFCQGVNSRKNEYFNWLPIQPLKGETLSISMDGLMTDVLVNRGVYLVPQFGNWKVGATYSREIENKSPTPEGRQELESKMKEIFDLPYKVLKQEAGFRPTTPDRRPILGSHPAHSNVMIFNGLGTKGVSLSPYFSGQFVRWMEKGEGLMKEADISRFKSLYWNSRVKL